MSRLGCTFFLALLLFFIKDVYSRGCAEFAVGLTHQEQLPDNYFTASSTYDKNSLPSSSRLDSKASWKPLRIDNDDEYLQVDLNLDYQICAIATKGGSDLQWTTKYRLSYSLDNRHWIKYKENGKDKLFHGNRDRDTLRKHILLAKPILRFIRLYPISYRGWKAIRMELYGVYINNCKQPLGLENYGIDNGQISTDQKNPSLSHHSCRLHGLSSWKPSVKEKYLQVDLGEMKFVKGIATQGHPHESMWVTSYTIEFKSTKDTWYEYTPSKDQESFPGNVDNTRVVVQWFDFKQHVRYVKVTPKTWHKRIALRMELYGCGHSCENQPIEIIKSYIINNTSSRDNNTTVASLKHDTYCFNDNYTNVQVDLGNPYLVCAVATRSTESDKWVETYTLQTSLDGHVWSAYRQEGEQGGATSLTGNSYSNSRNKNVLETHFTARYVKLLAVDEVGRRCIKVEVYGISLDACSKSITGASSTGQLPHYRFTASSQQSHLRSPAQGRLHGHSCWSPKTNHQFDYIQVDLGDPWTVCAVASQGFQDEVVLSFNIAYSMDGQSWTFYTNDAQRLVLFHKGNITKHLLDHHVSARFVRFYPLTYLKNKSLKIEVYGARQAWRQSLGIEQQYGVRYISDNQLTASEILDSLHTEKEGRLYDLSSWCAKQDHKHYFEVDLQSPKQVIGIATQGSPVSGHYVQEYDVQYSFTSDRWRVINALQANHDSRSVRVQWFKPSLGARYVRIVPTKWYGMICLRMDLYGNNNAPPPIITKFIVIGHLVPRSSSHVTIHCIAYAAPMMQIRWFTDGSDVTNKSRGQIYSRGQLITNLQVNYTSNIVHSCANSDVCTLVFYCQGKYKDNWGQRTEIKISINIDKTVFLSLTPVYSTSTEYTPTTQPIQHPTIQNIKTDSSSSRSLITYFLTCILSALILIVQHF